MVTGPRPVFPVLSPVLMGQNPTQVLLFCCLLTVLKFPLIGLKFQLFSYVGYCRNGIRVLKTSSLNSVMCLFPSLLKKNDFSFAQVENKEVKKRILNDPVTFTEKFSEHAKSICEALLAKEVDKRMGLKNGTCDGLRAHPFFSSINWRKLDAGKKGHFGRSHVYIFLC